MWSCAGTLYGFIGSRRSFGAFSLSVPLGFSDPVSLVLSCAAELQAKGYRLSVLAAVLPESLCAGYAGLCDTQMLQSANLGGFPTQQRRLRSLTISESTQSDCP